SCRTRPYRGWPGSVTVTWPSHTSVTRGVLRWLGFSRPRIAQQAAVVVLADPLAPGQLEHLLLAHAGRRREIKGLQSLARVKARLLDPAGQGVGRPGRHLQFRQTQKILRVALSAVERRAG